MGAVGRNAAALASGNAAGTFDLSVAASPIKALSFKFKGPDHARLAYVSLERGGEEIQVIFKFPGSTRASFQILPFKGTRACNKPQPLCHQYGRASVSVRT